MLILVPITMISVFNVQMASSWWFKQADTLSLCEEVTTHSISVLSASEWSFIVLNCTMAVPIDSVHAMNILFVDCAHYQLEKILCSRKMALYSNLFTRANSSLIAQLCEVVGHVT